MVMKAANFIYILRLLNALKVSLQHESDIRERLRDVPVRGQACELSEERLFCSKCNLDCFFSQVYCDQCDLVSCFEHIDEVRP
jgi:hypothetical protein